MNESKKDLKLNAYIIAGVTMVLGAGFCLGAALGVNYGYKKGITVGESSAILETLANAGMNAIK